MRIPLVDLYAQYQTIKHETATAIEDVLEHMNLFLGPQVKAFERDFASYCGCEYGIGLSNGTDALILALRACGVGPGDEVITVANTFIATVEAIASVGATPVFVDIDPGTYTLDYHNLDHALTSRTRAFLPVHLYGHPVEMHLFLEFARAHSLRVIEDASQAHEAIYRGQRVGSFGDVGCFSFYCSKNLGAYGEAGICVTNKDDLAEKIRLLRNHGSMIRYRHEVLGTNSRLDELQAAILRVKLRYLEQWNAARRRHVLFYTQQLRDVVESVRVVRPWADHVYYVYVVQVQQRELFRQRMQQAGIATEIHYPTPIHLQPACKKYGYRPGSLPITEFVAERIVSLPMYPELTAMQTQTVVDAVKDSIVCEAAQM
jgi:dTDP-4-amino-4,6-dideoxygalactose transaminase